MTELRHQWVAVCPYELTPEDGLRLVGAVPGGVEGPPEQRAGDDPPSLDDPRPYLGTHNLLIDQVVVACMKCELAITIENANAPCTGEPEGELMYVGDDGKALRPDETSQRGGNVAPGAMASVGRNEPCPCGSGLKYKKCHGA